MLFRSRATGNLTVRSGGALTIDPTVSGSIDITASGGAVGFARTLDLSPGATLRIDGADAVRFNAGIALSGPAYANPIRITSSRTGGSVVGFAAGVLAGDTNSFELSGIGVFAPQVRVEAGRLVLDDLSIQGLAGAAIALRPVSGRSGAQLEVADLDIAGSGNIQLDAQIRAATLAVSTTAGAIAQGAGSALIIGGTTRIDASGDITLQSADNRFAQSVQASGQGVALRDGDDLQVTLAARADSSLTSAGALSLAATVTGAGSDLALVASGAVTQTAALRVEGAVTIAAGSSAVTLDRTDNQIGGAGSITGSGAVALRDSNALSVALSNSTTARIEAGGDLAITSSGTQALALQVASPGDVTVQSAGALTVRAPLAAATSDLTVTAGGALTLASLNVGGSLSLTAAGAIGQGDEAITGGGAADLRSSGGAVTLARAGNVFGGAVKLGATSAQLRDTGPLAIELTLQGDAVIEATGEISLSGAVTGVGSDLRVVPGAGASLTLGATTVGGDLDATSGTALAVGALNVGGAARLGSAGALTQTGDWTIAGATTLVAPGQSVTLARAGNDFGGTVSIESAALQIRDRNALALSLATSGAASVRAGGVARLSGTITGAGNGLSLDVGGAELGALTVPGNVLIASTGAVSQTGEIGRAHV